MGRGKPAPTLDCVVAFNFQRPLTPVGRVNDYPVAAATIEGATNSQQSQPSLRDELEQCLDKMAAALGGKHERKEDR